MLTGFGGTVPGTVAQFVPFTKNANVSLYRVFAYSLYSSEAKTYWNVKSAAWGTTSNARTVASKVGKPASAVRSASPGVLRTVV